MKTPILTSALAIAASAFLPATAAQPTSEEVLLESAAQNEARDRAIDFARGPIKSEADIRSYMHAHPASPLHRLSPAARDRFLASIRFNENGVTTYEYSDLRAELTASQVHEVLALFGIQRTTATIPGLRVASDADRAIVSPGGAVPNLFPDYNDMYCSGHATCSGALDKICTSNC